jgi:chitodextrinase
MMERKHVLDRGAVPRWAIAIAGLVLALALTGSQASAARSGSRNNCRWHASARDHARSQRSHSGHRLRAERRRARHARSSRRRGARWTARHGGRQLRACAKRSPGLAAANKHGQPATTLSGPTGLAATAGNTRVGLTWHGSNSAGISGYRVYRDGKRSGQTQGTSFTDTEVTNGVTYSYYVVAYDKADSASPPSNTVSATPAAGTTADTKPPSAPPGLSANAGDTQVSLAWGASSDSGGVAGYEVFRNGAQIAKTSATGFVDQGLTDGVSYSYYVTAYDTAGNASSPSNSVSATPVASTSTGTTDPSGEPMPVGDVPGWHQLFADEFTVSDPIGSFAGCSSSSVLTGQYCSGLFGSPYYNDWFAYPDGWSGTPTSGTYSPSHTLSFKEGMLDYYIHTEAVGSTSYHMIDAVEPKIPGGVPPDGGRLYGRYVVRARWDSLPGYHVSFLLWPDSGLWPLDGEIDFPEADMDVSNVAAFMHWQNATASGEQDFYTSALNPHAWHTYTIEWLSTGCAFYVDGGLIGRSTQRIPDTPMHWVLQTGTSFGEPTPSNGAAGHLQIDWAVAYAPA